MPDWADRVNRAVVESLETGRPAAGEARREVEPVEYGVGPRLYGDSSTSSAGAVKINSETPVRAC